MCDVVFNVFRSMEDVFINFVMIGKFDFRMLVDLIIVDIVWMEVCKIIFFLFNNGGLLSSLGGGLFGGFFF